MLFTVQTISDHFQVEFQDQNQNQLMLKHYEIYNLEQDLPKRVRAKLVSHLQYTCIEYLPCTSWTNLFCILLSPGLQNYVIMNEISI